HPTEERGRVAGIVPWPGLVLLFSCWAVGVGLLRHRCTCILGFRRRIPSMRPVVRWPLRYHGGIGHLPGTRSVRLLLSLSLPSHQDSSRGTCLHISFPGNEIAPSGPWRFSPARDGLRGAKRKRTAPAST